ncbi:MAG TPA: choice-of-anchor Q domain-containing protein, partial [Chitinophagales bacterium]|nr:choice-of-anchor Q domain-containing protein [Chitinophagales bacterium]
SPAINAGSNAVIPSNITIDLDGNPRIYNSGIVDMGAYEAQGLTGLPAAPTATTPQSFCGSATVAYLDITNGMVIKWYAATTGGSALLSTASLSTRSYFASQTVGGCESRRTEVSVTINTIPAAPTATTSQAFCGSGTVANLVATGTAIKWYDAATGGSELLTTTSLSTRSYFASQTLNGCESPRTEVAVTVNTIPAVPTATNPQSFCGSATVANLTFTNGTGIKWYNVATGGSELLTTTSLSTSSYFASQIENGCESPRTEVEVTVNTIPATPTATNPQNFCGSATVANLTITNGTGIKWYATSGGGTVLATSTDLVNGNTYYASQTVSGCESFTRRAVSVSVNPIPIAPTATTSQAFCGSGTVANLVATGTAIKWYATGSGGTALATSTALVNGNTYYASQTVSGCESIIRTGVSVSLNVIIRYVKQGGIGDESGTSWTNASGDLQLMIKQSCPNSEVWVAQGTYLSSASGFILKNDVKIFGGFSNIGSPIFNERDPNSYPSILSGDNIRRVFYNNFSPSSKLTNSSILDGFTITEGNSGNGAGMYNANASPTLRNLIFKNNNSTGKGGAMYNAASNPLIVHCKFFENTSTNSGSAVCNASISTPSILGCLFVGNTAIASGGAIFADNASSYELINGTLYNNTGGGLSHAGNTTHPTVKNSIIYGNGQQVLNISAATAAIEYSLIEGGYIGIGNLDANPLFINTASNYSLQPCSPAINAGNNTAIPLGISTDIAGNQRIYESTVDIGAYENKGFSLQNIANSSLTSTGDCQTSDGWRHFYHNDGTDNKIFVSIQPQGQNLGTINASTKLNTHYGDEAKILIDPYQVVPFHIPFNRSWIVNTSKTFSSPVSVRFYFSDRDSIDLHNTIPIDSLEELIVYKVSGNNIWDVNSTGYKRHLHGTIADTSTYIFGNYQNLQYAEFQVNEFSTGTLGFKNSILPLNLISFTASAIEDKTQLQWRTVNEVNVSRFEIERSSDGIQWENISSTSASNGIEQNYTAWDNAPLAGSNYYRLKMIDIDGTFKYSKIVEVTFGNIENSANFQIYPNPNNGSFLIKAYGIGAKILPIKIYDNLGRVIHQNDIKEGTNSVDLKNLISGIYYLSIEKATEKKIYKIVIE